MFIIDRAVYYFFEGLPHQGIASKFFLFFTQAGDNGYLWLGLTLGLMLASSYRRYALGLTISLVLVALIALALLKPLVHRPRPFIVFDSLPLLNPAPHDYSFPSGHTSSSFVAFFYLYFNKLKPMWPIFIVACLVAISRLYFSVHFFTDIVGGIVLAFIIAYAVTKMGNRGLKGITG
jgi:undecaprenyl-diphosphatase